MTQAGSGLGRRLPSLVGRWRNGSTSGPDLSPSELQAASRDLLRLQRGLTGDRGLAGTSYMEDKGLLGAYFLYYWPVSYLQVSLALAALGSPSLRRVLDLGSGPGPASAACIDAGCEELVLADSSPRALELARSILSGPSQGLPGKAATKLGTRVLDLEAADPLPDGPFDAIVASHLLNELWKGREDRIEKRLALVEAAQTRLAPGGFLLLIEPSLLSTSRDLLSLRDRLTHAGSTILGPCLRQGGCPALAAGPAHTCHAEAAWDPPEPVASLAIAAGLDRESVKMTWIAVSAAGASPPEGPFAAESAGAIEALVVSSPMLNKAGRIRFILCDRGGRYTFSARKDDAEAAAQGFFALRRHDMIAICGAEARNGADPGASRSLGFKHGTIITIAQRVLVDGGRHGQA